MEYIRPHFYNDLQRFAHIIEYDLKKQPILQKMLAIRYYSYILCGANILYKFEYEPAEKILIDQGFGYIKIKKLHDYYMQCHNGISNIQRFLKNAEENYGPAFSKENLTTWFVKPYLTRYEMHKVRKLVKEYKSYNNLK